MAEKITVIGSGLMGAGIAQTCAQAGFKVAIQDINGQQVEAARAQIEKFIRRGAEKGQYSNEEAEAIIGRLSATSSLQEAAQDADWVIEAIFESMPAKKELFGKLAQICPAHTIFASNTSGLSISEMGAISGRPERFVGLHFFNPVPLMKLVEVVRGAATEETIVQAAVELGKKLGKTPVVCDDSTNFIVNRINRPVGYESQLLVSEGVTPQAVDKAMVLGASFKMGPLATGDYSGLNIGLAVSENIYKEFGDPKYRPIPLVRKMVRAGHTGRKPGIGFYLYPNGTTEPQPRWPDLALPEVAAPERVAVVGDNEEANRLRGKIAQAKFQIVEPEHAQIVFVPEVYSTDYKSWFAETARQSHPEAVLVALKPLASVTELGAAGGRPVKTIGAFCPLIWVHSKFFEIQLGLDSSMETAGLVQALFNQMSYHTVITPEVPAGIVLRIISCMINEAAFCLQEKLATAEDIDVAMRLGMNYAHGPLEYADRMGIDNVLAILEYLQAETGDPRYRPAPILKKMVRARHLGFDSGQGFHSYR